MSEACRIGYGYDRVAAALVREARPDWIWLRVGTASNAFHGMQWMARLLWAPSRGGFFSGTHVRRAMDDGHSWSSRVHFRYAFRIHIAFYWILFAILSPSWITVALMLRHQILSAAHFSKNLWTFSKIGHEPRNQLSSWQFEDLGAVNLMCKTRHVLRVVDVG